MITSMPRFVIGYLYRLDNLTLNWLYSSIIPKNYHEYYACIWDTVQKEEYEVYEYGKEEIYIYLDWQSIEFICRALNENDELHIYEVNKFIEE